MSRRGFTYVEMLVIIGINVIAAALIMPNLITDKARRDVWAFRSQLASLARQARSTAIESNDETSLSFDQNKNCFELVESHQNTAPTVVRTLDLPNGVTADKFAADQNESAAQVWEVPFYTDGTTPGGGVQFGPAEHTFCLMIRRATAEPIVQDSELPDISQESWPAGGYAPRQ